MRILLSMGTPIKAEAPFSGSIIGTQEVRPFIQTRVTDVFGINYPILIFGMSRISVPKIVAVFQKQGVGYPGHKA